MTRLAPARIAGLMMGVWFLPPPSETSSAGASPACYESFALPTLFGAVAGFAIVAALILLVFVGPMRRMLDVRARRRDVRQLILLLSTYELGRQPFGLASPAAWLRGAGVDVASLDLSIDAARCDGPGRRVLVAVHLPMHTATRLALPVSRRSRAARPPRPCAPTVSMRR